MTHDRDSGCNSHNRCGFDQNNCELRNIYFSYRCFNLFASFALTAGIRTRRWTGSVFPRGISVLFKPAGGAEPAPLLKSRYIGGATPPTRTPRNSANLTIEQGKENTHSHENCVSLGDSDPVESAVVTLSLSTLLTCWCTVCTAVHCTGLRPSTKFVLLSLQVVPARTPLNSHDTFWRRGGTSRAAVLSRSRV